MSELVKIAEKISDLKRGGVHHLDSDTEKFIGLMGDAFSQVYESLKEQNPECKLGDIAKKLQDLKYNRDTNVPSGIMRPFFGLVGEAFKEMNKLIKDNKVASSNIKQKAVQQIADNQKQR